MSRNEEERGSFLLPSAAVTPLRRALLEAANAERAEALTCATAVYDALQNDGGRMKELRRALKNREGHSALRRLIEALDPTPTAGLWHRSRPKWVDDVRELAVQMLLKYDPEKRASKLRKPLKMHAAPLPTGTLRFQAGDEGHIVIDPAARTVSWTVDRNNHSVERARESRLGQAFFKALQAIIWTRGTGGHLTATDEYAEDAARDNGHFDSGRTTTSLGPLGESQRAQDMGVSVARMRKISTARPRY